MSSQLTKIIEDILGRLLSVLSAILYFTSLPLIGVILLCILLSFTVGFEVNMMLIWPPISITLLALSFFYIYQHNASTFAEKIAENDLRLAKRFCLLASFIFPLAVVFFSIADGFVVNHSAQGGDINFCDFFTFPLQRCFQLGSYVTSMTSMFSLLQWYLFGLLFIVHCKVKKMNSQMEMSFSVRHKYF
jgi:hypothetical protein